MKIDDLTIGEMRQLVSMLMLGKANECPFVIGKSYFVRLATYHVLGTVDRIVGDFVVLKAGTASWIADSGRFQQAIDDGKLNEVEPVGTEIFFNMNNVIDVYPWEH